MKSFQIKSLLAVLFLFTTLLHADDEAIRLRIAAANISSGNKQTYDPGHGIRIFQSAKPDVVAMQEMNYGDNSPKDIRKFVDEAFGKEFQYYREEKDEHGKIFKIPNGIVSRYPLTESGSWYDMMPDRNFAWAKIKLPDGQTLLVVSVHFSTKNAGNRDSQAQRLVAKIKELNLPEGALFVIAGDLNTKSENESALKTLGKITLENHPPTAPNGLTFTNATDRYRYDWLLPSPGLEKYHVDITLKGDPEKMIPDKSLKGLIYDTRKFNDYLLPPPAKKDDSAAEGMQHMMVVKDFLIPKATAHKEPDAATHTKPQ